MNINVFGGRFLDHHKYNLIATKRHSERLEDCLNSLLLPMLQSSIVAKANSESGNETNRNLAQEFCTTVKNDQSLTHTIAHVMKDHAICVSILNRVVSHSQSVSHLTISLRSFLSNIYFVFIVHYYPGCVLATFT